MASRGYVFVGMVDRRTGWNPGGRIVVRHRVQNAGPRVALTFDDGDSPEAWRAILDALEDRDATATFFPLGIRVEESPELSRRTVSSGHAVGSHGYDHAWLVGMGRAAVRERLERDVVLWRTRAGVSGLALFRPPFGMYDATTLSAAEDARYRDVVLWDVDPHDWRAPGPARIHRRVLRAVRPGSVVLLHVVEDTAKALPGLIDGLRDRDLEPVTFPVLAAAGRERARTQRATP